MSDFKAKMHQIRFRLSAAGFCGPTSVLLRRGAKGGEEKGRGRKRKWKEEEGEEKGKKGGKGSPWASDSQKQIFWLRRCSFIDNEMEAVVAYIK